MKKVVLTGGPCSGKTTVLRALKEEFGDSVFETVIRYNIRLRETVDHGLPVGDYDRHAIGHKDYAKLAEEVMGSEIQIMAPAYYNSSTTSDILQQTERYINTVADPPPMVAEPAHEPEEFFVHARQSLYSDMVEAISANLSDATSEDNEEIEEYQ